MWSEEDGSGHNNNGNYISNGSSGSSYGGGEGAPVEGTGISCPSGLGGGLLILRCESLQNPGTLISKGEKGISEMPSSGNYGAAGSSGSGCIAIFSKSCSVSFDNLIVGLKGADASGYNPWTGPAYGGRGGDGKAAYISLNDEIITELNIN